MKLTKNSFGIKLLFYIILFATIILSALWLMQIVFLQSFYESMKTKDVEKVATTLGKSYGSPNFEATLDETAFTNSLLVFVTDNSGTILYSTDEHGPSKPKLNPSSKNFNDNFRPLPMGYDEFLNKLEKSDNKMVSYTVNWNDFRGKSLVCGISLSDAALYISAPLDPVDATTSILRTQLVYITVVALVLSFVIAFFISRRFSQPVSSITQQAKKLAVGEFPQKFDKGFCAELDELADTLSYASGELSKVEKLRRELIANISHDLRTPLTMIKAYTEMIRDISGDNKEKREAHLTIIAGETEHLTNLVNDILALSSIQSGNEVLAVENIDISSIVKKVISRFEPIFLHEGYKFSTTIEPDQYVHADAKKIEQVLYNFIGNAMNYIGDDKTIIVKVINLGGRVRVEISDKGGGIPEDELLLIWDRYYKAKTHKRNAAGAGLGLSIVKGILEMHSAKYGVLSTPKQGSTFWFELTK